MWSERVGKQRTGDGSDANAGRSSPSNTGAGTVLFPSTWGGISAPDNQDTGCWMADPDGAVTNYGTAENFGSMGGSGVDDVIGM